MDALCLWCMLHLQRRGLGPRQILAAEGVGGACAEAIQVEMQETGPVRWQKW